MTESKIPKRIQYFNSNSNPPMFREIGSKFLASNELRRRSRSLSELNKFSQKQGIPKAPKSTELGGLNAKGVTRRVPLASKEAGKRSIEKEFQKPTKSKVCNKIPVWDYKSRFYALQEDFNKLTLERLELQESVKALEEAKSELITKCKEIQKSVETLEADKSELIITCNNLFKEKQELIASKSILEKSFCELEANFKSLSERNSIVTRKLETGSFISEKDFEQLASDINADRCGLTGLQTRQL